MIQARPVTLEGHGVRLEPLTAGHADDLSAAAADGAARWLLSRDAEVLRLARRTHREGLFEILAPDAWCAAWQAR